MRVNGHRCGSLASSLQLAQCLTGLQFNVTELEWNVVKQCFTEDIESEDYNVDQITVGVGEAITTIVSKCPYKSRT